MCPSLAFLKKSPRPLPMLPHGIASNIAVSHGLVSHAGRVEREKRADSSRTLTDRELIARDCPYPRLCSSPR
jgi:hypothetical protein